MESFFYLINELQAYMMLMDQFQKPLMKNVCSWTNFIHEQWTKLYQLPNDFTYVLCFMVDVIHDKNMYYASKIMMNECYSLWMKSWYAWMSEFQNIELSTLVIIWNILQIIYTIQIFINWPPFGPFFHPSTLLSTFNCHL